MSAYLLCLENTLQTKIKVIQAFHLQAYSKLLKKIFQK